MPSIQITDRVIRDSGDGRIHDPVAPDEIGGSAQILPAGGTDGGGRLDERPAEPAPVCRPAGVVGAQGRRVGCFHGRQRIGGPLPRNSEPEVLLRVVLSLLFNLCCPAWLGSPLAGVSGY